MRLTQYSDYALRALIYLAVVPAPHQLVNIQDIADSYNISKNHLTKIIHQLGTLGLIESVRGKHGGIRLARSPKDINIGAVLRHTEADFMLVDCFMPVASQHTTNNQDIPNTASPPATQPRAETFNLASPAIPINEKQQIIHVTQLPIDSACVISPACQLKPLFFEAIQAFISVFDRYTLADLVSNQAELHTLLK